MRMGDGHGEVAFMIEQANAVRISRPRMLAPVSGRKVAVHEIERLADHGIGSADEGRQSELGPNGLPVAVMQSAARRRAEECVVRGERCPDLVKQIGALRQFEVAVQVSEPLGLR